MVSVRVPLTQGKVAMVSLQDAERVMAHKWRAQKARNTWYAVREQRTNGKRTTILMHRFIAILGDEILTDHRDRNGLNNTRTNLRPATPSQNAVCGPMRSINTSGHRGVCRFQGGKWQAYINVDGKRISLGCAFNSIEQAIAARKQAEEEMLGEFRPAD